MRSFSEIINCRERVLYNERLQLLSCSTVFHLAVVKLVPPLTPTHNLSATSQGNRIM